MKTSLMHAALVLLGSSTLLPAQDKAAAVDKDPAPQSPAAPNIPEDPLAAQAREIVEKKKQQGIDLDAKYEAGYLVFGRTGGHPEFQAFSKALHIEVDWKKLQQKVSDDGKSISLDIHISRFQFTNVVFRDTNVSTVVELKDGAISSMSGLKAFEGGGLFVEVVDAEKLIFILGGSPKPKAEAADPAAAKD